MPFVLAGVLLVAIPLLMCQSLRWGWWSAIGGDGNPIFGSSNTTMGTVWAWLIPLDLHGARRCSPCRCSPTPKNACSAWVRSVGAPRQRVLKVLQFGLIHAVIGIPIGVALALSVGGAYFMAVYLRSYTLIGSVNEATLESTRAHTAYNALIITTVAVVVAVGAVA